MNAKYIEVIAGPYKNNKGYITSSHRNTCTVCIFMKINGEIKPHIITLPKSNLKVIKKTIYEYQATTK